MVGFTSAELQALVALWILPFARIAALFSSAPVLSHAGFPVRLRLAAALAVTAAVTMASPQAAPPNGAAFLGALVEQVAVGLACGFAMQLVFAAAQVAGEVIGLQMGLGFASLFDPGGAGQSSLVGSLLTLAALLLFLAVDGHLVLIEAVATSFRELPPGSLFATLDPQALAQAGGTVFRLAVQLSIAPLAGLLLVNLAFGFIARVSPQLNVFSVGFPAALLAGMALLVIAAPGWMSALEAALRASLAALVKA